MEKGMPGNFLAKTYQYNRFSDLGPVASQTLLVSLLCATHTYPSNGLGNYLEQWEQSFR